MAESSKRPSDHSSSPVSRRQFTAASLASLAMAGVHSSVSAAEPKGANDKIVVGVMGLNSRGGALTRTFVKQPNCEIAYLCDVDSRAIEKVGKSIGAPTSKAVTDFRKVLDDKAVDVLVVAAPDHWHAPATILGCSAGKHVYVEKPCCHNPAEGEMQIAAANKYKRVVTMGVQRRSWPILIEAMELVRSGNVIGKPLYARARYTNRRPSIGKGKEAPVPAWLDYSLWQGPAPERPFKDNLLHYNWHWMWNWGTGELGNNGVHGLDLARWGMGVDFPTRVSSIGTKTYGPNCDQETPDTNLVTFEFGDQMIMWEGLSRTMLGGDSAFGTSFHGEKGTIVVNDSGYIVYDNKNKEVSKKEGSGGDGSHIEDFLSCIRTPGKKPTAVIEEGYKSTLMCHLGNISWRTGQTLEIDSTNGHIKNSPEGQKLWGREYRAGWEPKV